jgi:hypothetical protein
MINAGNLQSSHGIVVADFGHFFLSREVALKTEK